MRRQHPALLHDTEDEERIERIAGISEPPTRIAEPDLFDAVLDLEAPGIAGVAGKLPLHAVLVGRRMLHYVDFRMCGEHLIVDLAREREHPHSDPPRSFTLRAKYLVYPCAIAPRALSMIAPAFGGISSDRQATCPSGRTRTSRRL